LFIPTRIDAFDEEQPKGDNDELYYGIDE